MSKRQEKLQIEKDKKEQDQKKAEEDKKKAEEEQLKKLRIFTYDEQLYHLKHECC